MPEIYALCEPATGEVRYIGKATSAAKRLAGHLREKRRRSPLYSWIERLRRAGESPTLRVLEACASGEWQDRERALISEYRVHGRLLNMADGGDEPLCSTETRAANGRAIAAKIHSDPELKRIWALKQRIGSALKAGYISDGAKAKLRLAAQKCPQLFGEWATL